MAEYKIEDIDVHIEYAYISAVIPLSEWIECGPPKEGRIFISPGQAYLHGTKKELPLSVIPLEYRNNGESIRAILNGEIMEPWGRSTKMLTEMLKYI